MKKLLSFILIFLFLFSFSACGKKAEVTVSELMDVPSSPAATAKNEIVFTESTLGEDFLETADGSLYSGNIPMEGFNFLNEDYQDYNMTSLILDGNNLYYILRPIMSEEQPVLYRNTIDMSSPEVLAENLNYSTRLCLADGYLCFTDSDYVLRVISPDSGDELVSMEGCNAVLSACGGWIFYRKTDNSLYRNTYDLSQEIKVLENNMSSWLYVTEDSLATAESGESGELSLIRFYNWYGEEIASVEVTPSLYGMNLYAGNLYVISDNIQVFSMKNGSETDSFELPGSLSNPSLLFTCSQGLYMAGLDDNEFVYWNQSLDGSKAETISVNY